MIDLLDPQIPAAPVPMRPVDRVEPTAEQEAERQRRAQENRRGINSLIINPGVRTDESGLRINGQ